MEGAFLAFCFTLLYTAVQSIGVMPGGTQIKALNACVGQTLHLTCPHGKRIHIPQFFYGRSHRGCSYDPKGCVKQDYGYHYCTGQSQCEWTVPFEETSTCGPADYVSVTQRCLPDNEITDICSVKNLTADQGYLASPQYPAPLPVTQHSCKLTVSATDRHHVIIFYMYDIGDGDCKGELALKDAARPRPKTLRLCSSIIRSRGQRIYTSSSSLVEITYSPLASSSNKGFLIYYKVKKKPQRFVSRIAVRHQAANAPTPAPTRTTLGPSTSPNVHPIPPPQLARPNLSPEDTSEEEGARSTAALRETLLHFLRNRLAASSTTRPPATTRRPTQPTTRATTPQEVRTKQVTKEPTTTEKITQKTTEKITQKTTEKTHTVIKVKLAKATAKPTTPTTTTEQFLRGQVNSHSVTLIPTTRRVFVPIITAAPTRVTSTERTTQKTPRTTPRMPETTKRTSTTKRTTAPSTQQSPIKLSKVSLSEEKTAKVKTKSVSAQNSTRFNTERYVINTAQASLTETTTLLPGTIHTQVNGSTTHAPFGSIFGREKPRDSGPWAAIVGGVIASIAGILLLVIIGIMIWEKRKKKCVRTRMYDDVVITQTNGHVRHDVMNGDQASHSGRLPPPRHRIYENVQINGGFIPDEVQLKKRPSMNGTVNKDNVVNEARSSENIPGFGQFYHNSDMAGEETDVDKTSYDEVSMDQIRITTPHPVPAIRQSLTLQRSIGDTSEDLYCEIEDNQAAANKPQPPVRTASKRESGDERPPKPPIKPKPKVGSLRRWLDKATGRHKEPEVSPDSLIDVQMVENEVYESEEIRKS